MLSLQVFRWFVNTIGPEVCFTTAPANASTHGHMQTHLPERCPCKSGRCTNRQACVAQVNLHVDFTQVQWITC